MHLQELRDARWIAPAVGSSCGVMLDRSCALAGYEPHVVTRCDDFHLAAALVAAGHGVALLPATATPIDGTVALQLLIAVDPPIRRSLYIAVRHGGLASPALTHLVDAFEHSTTKIDRPNAQSQ